MTNEQFKDGVSVGSLIHNNDEKLIVRICSSWVRKERRGSGFPNGGHYILKEDDIDKWGIVDENSPLFVRFEVLQQDFKELKHFVNARLK